jgi:Surface glycan-binding protein B xyloglucan binding domain
MKTINKTLFLLIASAFIAVTFTSCKKDNSLGSGKPNIKYVRVTNPESSDSLLIGAHQGKLIAIVGNNLQRTSQVWFNDQQASLTATYITNTTVLVRVPNPIPLEINNKLKIYFSNGDSLLYDFQVQISKPSLTSMVSEYVNAGDVATIRGDFFYEPLTVAFTGGVNGEIVSVTDQLLQVRVPDGAQPGPVTVTSNFGVTKSDFWFRDNRNIFISSDPYEGWWNEGYVVTNPGPNDPPKINGNYIHVKKFFGAWSWNEIAGGPASAMPVQSKNIPDGAILKPADYNLKFEVNTIKPYNSSTISINVALNEQDNDGYKWQPPYDTKGQWQTVIIPFEEIVASYKVKPVINPNGYWTRLLVQGPGDWDADICFDNFRVVPKIDK